MLVLVADDDPMARALLTALCQGQGWEVRLAADAMQTLMFAVRDPKPDVILLDLKMPAGTGMKALERLRTTSRTAGIPVVVVSGSASDPAVVAEVEALGVVGVMSKPPDPETLVDMVRRATGAGGGAAPGDRKG